MQYTVEAQQMPQGDWAVVANGDVIFRGMKARQARKVVRELLGDIVEKAERVAGWPRCGFNNRHED